MFWVRLSSITLSALLLLSSNVAWTHTGPIQECRAIWNRLLDGKFHEKRRLIDYEVSLGSQFVEMAKKLRPHQTWLDAGSGQSYALTDYLEEFPEGGNTIGVTIKPVSDTRRIQEWVDEKKRLELIVGIDFLQIDPSTLGRPKLITDFFGVVSYTPQPDRALQIYLDILDTDGEIYLLSNLERTEIYLPNSEHPLPLHQWLRQIPGLQVESMNPGVIKITKTQAQVSIPRLKLLHLQDEQPPFRKYHL